MDAERNRAENIEERIALIQEKIPRKKWPSNYNYRLI